jgi:hypothetical protein
MTTHEYQVISEALERLKESLLKSLDIHNEKILEMLKEY